MEEIDEAFNWLVLVLGTLAASLFGSLHLYPLPSPPLTPRIEIQFMRLLFLPLVVLVITWLGSHLAQNKGIRIVLKSFSWIYALLLLLIDLAFFLSVILAQDIRGSPLGVGLLCVSSLSRRHSQTLQTDISRFEVSQQQQNPSTLLHNNNDIHSAASNSFSPPCCAVEAEIPRI